MATAEWKEEEYQKMLVFSKEKKSEMRILSKKEAKKLEEGFKLFNKYYFNLWD
jgi:hypothetical protein